MMWLLWLQAAALPVADAVPGEEVLVVRGDYLLLRHLVATETLPASTSGDLRLLRVPGGARTILLTETDQRELIRRRLPNVKLAPQQPRTLRIDFERAMGATSRTCFELNQPVAAGEPIDAGGATPIACDASRQRVRLSYDLASRAPVSAVALAAGSYLGPVALPSLLPQPTGQTMTLRTRVGPMTIDRAAVLVQPGRAGRHAFVRLSDGKIISAPLADDGGPHDTQ
ncbi:hypothetical protein [Sphingopyxis sp. KK2]|uniref:hypothetical protein n=1 Tax=Sphingopyxis sp. KK2 TaxID=1855727 RepID=UPI00097E6B60|nr:hypothetical protein [Sphingopyxis sp. KK2]